MNGNNLDKLALANTREIIIPGAEFYEGKVRSVYWLTPKQSRKLIMERVYQVPENTQLGVLIISDRISAFDAIWEAEGGLKGVPGKGAALNAISKFFFDMILNELGIRNHLLEAPHPLVWIVQKAQPQVMVEGIVRKYITGSMWRAYAKGDREFCGVTLPDGLTQHQMLNELLFTPTAKGSLNIPGLPTDEDANLTMDQIAEHYSELGFANLNDLNSFVTIINNAFNLISKYLARRKMKLVDTKFEGGYVKNAKGELELGLIDEIVTPDSSRYWDADEYEKGNIIENSKEAFRQMLLGMPFGPALVDKNNSVEMRREIARNNPLPAEIMFKMSDLYNELVLKITGQGLPAIENPREEILDLLREFGLV